MRHGYRNDVVFEIRPNEVGKICKVGDFFEVTF